METKIKLTKLNPHIYLMDNDQASSYIVLGTKKALVIDTMMGYENVKDVVRRVTDLPIIVVNTHGHCDHIFGNVFFEEVYMNPDDLPVAKEHMAFPEFVDACNTNHISMPPFQPIYDGDIIDIGGLTLQVIAFPGHTPGGICLLLKEERILFTGDGINHHLWMQLPESSKIKDYLQILDDHRYLMQEADLILHGHAKGFDDISLMLELRNGLADLIETRGIGDEDYKWFGGIGKQHRFGDENSVICYAMDKL